MVIIPLYYQHCVAIVIAGFSVSVVHVINMWLINVYTVYCQHKALCVINLLYIHPFKAPGRLKFGFTFQS